MLKDRRELEEILTNQFKKVLFNQKVCVQIYDFAEEKYNIPAGTMADIVSMRTNVSELNYFLLYATTDCLEHCTSIRKIIAKFFSESEQNMFDSMKYENESIEFPLRFKMIPVADDQWIGTISAKMIVKLCKAQLLAYNANTQRAMKMNIVHGQKVYRPALNMSAVNTIQEAMENGIYIPNTLTFNILDEDDFYYNAETSELVIRSLKHFDITDGYHRYQALIRILNDNPDFDIKMELRITNFYEDKAKQFIYQEDQKTKMRKVDSDAMNTYNPGNRVVSKINESRISNFVGLITPTSNIISYADMSAVVNNVVFKGVNKKDEAVIVNEITKQLIQVTNEMSDLDNLWLQHSYTTSELLAIVYLVKTYPEITGEQLGKVLRSKDVATLGYYASQKVYKKHMNILEKVYAEVK